MFKKIAVAGIGIALFASPFIVSAQTITLPSLSTSASVEQLQTLIAQLTQILQQLLAQRKPVSEQVSYDAHFLALPASGAAPLSVTFVAAVGGAGYVIDFGDGVWGGIYQITPVAERSYGAPAHTYTSAGTYTAKLYSFPSPYTVDCSQSSWDPSCRVVATAVVHVNGVETKLTLSASPTSGPAPHDVTFIIGPQIVVGNEYYMLDFGDGGSKQLSTPWGLINQLATHTYVNTGTYFASLKAVNGDMTWPIDRRVTITVGDTVVPSPQSAAPGTPNTPVATCNASGDSVVLSWTPGVNNSSYHLRVNDPMNDSVSCQDGWFCPNTGDSKQDLTFTLAPQAVVVPVTVVPNKIYEWWVHGGNANMLSSPIKSSFVCVPKTPETLAAPSGLVYKCATDGTKVTLSWNRMPTAVWYYLRINDASNDTTSCRDGWFCPGSADLSVDGLTSNSQTITVKPGQVYSWWVQGAQGNTIGPATTSKFVCNSDHVAEAASAAAYISDDLSGTQSSNLASALTALESALKGILAKLGH